MSGEEFVIIRDCDIIIDVRWWKFKRVDVKLNSERIIHGYRIPPFVSDLGSVPFGFRWLFSPFGEYAEEAILHDYLLKIMPRREAAHEFRYVMKSKKYIPNWRLNCLYLAVRARDRYVAMKGRLGFE